MKKVLIVFIIVFPFFYCSTVGVSDKNIATIEVALYKRPDGHTTGEPRLLAKVMPGERCLLRLTVYTKEGTKIEKPNIHDFIITSPNQSFIYFEKNFDDPLCFTANPDSFFFSDGKKFLLKINVINNSFKDMDLSWDVDWSAASVFEFSGKDGSKKHINFSLAGLFPSGKDGLDGESGENGLFCHFDVAYYSTTAGEMPPGVKTAVVYDRIRDELYFTKIETQLLFITRGGNGGDGTDALPGKNGKMGGNGGNGGDGGSGGDIIINLHEKTDLQDFIQVIQNGGKGGAGGKGGVIPEGDAEEQGQDGLPGINGRAGKLIINRLTSFSTMFTNISHPRFRRSRLRY